MNPAAHPFRLPPAAQIAATSAEQNIADLIRLVLLTRSGERLHHADFGASLGASGLFQPIDDALLGLIESRARGSLDAALGDRIEVLDLTVARQDESTIVASVTYRIRPAGNRTTFDVTVRT